MTVLPEVLAAQKPGANAIPLFFGENRTFDGEAGPGARRVDLQRDSALDDRALRALYDVRRRRQRRAARRKASPVQSGDRSKRWLVR